MVPEGIWHDGQLPWIQRSFRIHSCRNEHTGNQNRQQDHEQMDQVDVENIQRGERQGDCDGKHQCQKSCDDASSDDWTLFFFVIFTEVHGYIGEWKAHYSNDDQAVERERRRRCAVDDEIDKMNHREYREKCTVDDKRNFIIIHKITLNIWPLPL